MSQGPPSDPQPCVEVDCARALVEIYTYLDGELTEERRTLIAAHIETCGPCLDIFDFEAELRTVVQQRCRDQVPEHLRRRILQALEGLEADPPAPV